MGNLMDTGSIPLELKNFFFVALTVYEKKDSKQLVSKMCKWIKPFPRLNVHLVNPGLEPETT